MPTARDAFLFPLGVENMTDAPEGYEAIAQTQYWNPDKEGDELRGQVIDVIDGKFGKQYAIKKEGSEEVVVTSSHKGLQTRMMSIMQGDLVTIRYTGTVPTNQGNDAKTYEVFRKKV